jgi:hypothetical protein
VFDIELVNFYFKLGLTPQTIHKHLPRLRGAHLSSDHSLPLSWLDIASRLAKIVVVRDNG